MLLSLLHGADHLRVKKIQELDLIEFWVADTGIGIEADDMARIFSPLSRSGSPHRRF